MSLSETLLTQLVLNKLEFERILSIGSLPVKVAIKEAGGAVLLFFLEMGKCEYGPIYFIEIFYLL